MKKISYQAIEFGGGEIIELYRCVKSGDDTKFEVFNEKLGEWEESREAMAVFFGFSEDSTHSVSDEEVEEYVSKYVKK